MLCSESTAAFRASSAIPRRGRCYRTAGTGFEPPPNPFKRAFGRDRKHSVTAKCGSTTSDQVGRQYLSLTDLLLRINKVALYFTIHLFNDVSSFYKAEAEEHLDLLTDWTKHLWSAIPGQLSNDLSHRQAWLIAESARRNMIAPYLMRIDIVLGSPTD